MKVSLIQMKIGADKAANLARAKALALDEARGSDVIILPEMFCCPYSRRAFRRFAESEDGEVTRVLSDIARETGAYLIGGSMPEAGVSQGEEGNIYNTCFVFDPDGNRIAKHRKAHMFDINIENGLSFRESDTLTAGEGVTKFDTPFGRFGVCICFDIRFSAFIHEMSDIDFLAVPAAFNMTTGPLHWELLFRARAVDEQIFTFGCAPARTRDTGYVSYANSIAVDPFGRVIAKAGARECLITVEVDRADVVSARRQIPIGKQSLK